MNALAGSVPFLRLAGTALGGWLLARSALVAQAKLASRDGDPAFLEAKLITARFYAEVDPAAGAGPARPAQGRRPHGVRPDGGPVLSARPDRAARRTKPGPSPRRFDLAALEPAFLDDPFPYYHALRRFAPLKRLPDGSVFLSRYADVAVCYRDARMAPTRRPSSARSSAIGTPLYRASHDQPGVQRPAAAHAGAQAAGRAFTPRALADAAAAHRGGGRRAARRARRQGPHGPGRGLRLPPARRGDLRHAGRAARASARRFRRYSLAILGALEPVAGPERQAAGNAAVARVLGLSRRPDRRARASGRPTIATSWAR